MTAMDETMSDFHFKLMSFGFKFRDFFKPRENILEQAGIKPGFYVLDYGCGPGSYLTAAAELVGKSGKIYALDIHPLAIQKVNTIAAKKRLSNVVTINSDCKTGLPDNSIDLVLLYDTFHSLSDPNRVLEELHRILKTGGILSFSDHHMNENEILHAVINGGLFKFFEEGKEIYNFIKEDQ